MSLSSESLELSKISVHLVSSVPVWVKQKQQMLFRYVIFQYTHGLEKKKKKAYQHAMAGTILLKLEVEIRGRGRREQVLIYHESDIL